MRRVFVLVCMMSLMLTGAGQAAEWLVERVSGTVAVSSDGGTWRAVRSGQAIPNAHWIRTGPKARVLLSKGNERIMFRENTTAAISVSQPSGQKTKISQRHGSILVSAQKRRKQHLSVVTPHLAAVVKGTVFEVTVSRNQSAVRVDEGRVRVSDGNNATDVPAGKLARKGAKAPKVTVEAATVTSLTGNGVVGTELAGIASNRQASDISDTRRNATGRSDTEGQSNDRSGGSTTGASGGRDSDSSGGNGAGGSRDGSTGGSTSGNDSGGSGTGGSDDKDD